MRSKHLITIAAVAFSSIVCAQMPVPLLDNEPAAPNATLWAVAGPMLQAALECREDLPDHPATRALLPRKPAGEEQHYRLTPPSGFKVFGLPVAEIEVWVDDGSGELGHGYTSHIRGRTLAEVAKAATLNKGRSFPNRKTPMGGLMADQPFGPESVQLTCTIDGSYAAHENEYREP